MKIRGKKSGEKGVKTNAAQGPATLEPHRSWTFEACLPAAFGSGTTAPIRQHSPCERHIYQCGCRAAIPGITTQQLLRLASSPTQLTEREVEEAAMPGQPACARALPIFPRQFTLENRRSAASLAAIIVASLRRSYVFGEPTVRQIVARRNRKTFRPCAETVDDRTSLWKPEENSEGTFVDPSSPSIDSMIYDFMTYDSMTFDAMTYTMLNKFPGIARPTAAAAKGWTRREFPPCLRGWSCRRAFCRSILGRTK